MRRRNASHSAPLRADHYCAGIQTIVPGDPRGCAVCLGLVKGEALEQLKRTVRKRRDRGQMKRELWIPSNA